VAMDQAVDVVIVGGGVGGSALGANLAQAGLEVEILEREVEFVDRVRGEWMAPWGVAETKRLGIYDQLMAAGGHHVTRMCNYDELLSPAQAEATAASLAGFHPEAPGPLCMEHVTMQNVLLEHASGCGARVRRGVSHVQVEAGASPVVRYEHEGSAQSRRCRLIVGADGRTSTVRRQLGWALDEQPIDHFISGLLIDRASEWPADTQAVGKAGDVMYLVFPQGGGKIRLYVDYGVAERDRYHGAQGATNLLRAFDAPCLPGGDALAQATPIGPCRAYPSQDAEVHEPVLEGAVLIGDAAGYTDPIFGQGLSVTLRDVRVVRDLLLDNRGWSAALLAPYVAERSERVRRVMCVTRFGTTLFARFDEEGVRTRARAMQRLAAQPELGALFAAGLAGPDAMPAETFTQGFYDRIFAS
jgi:2-polyprenyl-6-methoxyphenol hydroxylase-like FAD-dependent oxidoreductase